MRESNWIEEVKDDSTLDVTKYENDVLDALDHELKWRQSDGV